MKYLFNALSGAFLGLVIATIGYIALSVAVPIFARLFLEKNSILYYISDSADYVFFLIPLFIAAMLYEADREVRYKQINQKDKCPKCGCINKNPISEEIKSIEYPDSYTETKRMDHFNADGDFKGYSEVEGETISFKSSKDYYEFRYNCYSCRHKWTKSLLVKSI